MKLENFTDDRPTQDSLPVEPDKSPKETRLDEGASDEFVDDRETFGTADSGKQSTIAKEPLDDDGQGDLFGETAAIEPEWSTESDDTKDEISKRRHDGAEKVDVSTFPHESDCTGANLRYIRCGSGGYWTCRECGAKGVKKGLQYESYSRENDTSSKTPEDLIEKEQAHPELDHRDDGKPIATEEWLGEIIFTSWGYGQTNVNAAVITGVSESGRTVKARMVALDRVGGVKSSDSVAPTEHAYGDEFRLRVKEGSGDPWFRGSYPYIDGDTDKGTRLDSFMPWGDREHTHQTATGYGH